MHTFKDPWRDCTDAFGPMFSDEVVFLARGTGTTGTTGTTDGIQRYPVLACVFTEEQVDPFIEHDSESSIRLLTVLVPKKNWRNPRFVQVGDSVFASGSRWTVAEIEDEHDWFKVRARRSKQGKGAEHGA